MTVTSRADAGLGASSLGWIMRAVAKKRTATISTGMTVQASSIWVLPYTCAGSRPEFSVPARNFRIEYANKEPTDRKTVDVTTSTHTAKPKMVRAGVDAGAKMLVELREGPAGSAALPATDQRAKRHT